MQMKLTRVAVKPALYCTETYLFIDSLDAVNPLGLILPIDLPLEETNYATYLQEYEDGDSESEVYRGP